MKIAELNHVALRVRDVEASSRFYRDIVGLAALPRPAFSFPGAWFRIGTGQELHLIEGEGGRGPEEGSRHNHFAMKIDDIDGAARHLREKGLEFRGPVQRPDGARQIFFRDPDGHVIEFCAELP